MTNEQILKKAIEKAVKNGWEGELPVGLKYLLEITVSGGIIVGHVYDTIIFSHDFAKAFWGEEKLPICEGRCGYIGEDMHMHKKEYFSKYMIKAWKHYLQQMVLEENPLDYIRKFL